jgi:hypothetical protein
MLTEDRADAMRRRCLWTIADKQQTKGFAVAKSSDFFEKTPSWIDSDKKGAILCALHRSRSPDEHLFIR